MERTIISLLTLFVILLFVNDALAITVEIEFLYLKPPHCPTCPPESEGQQLYDVYLHNSEVVQRIKRDYGEKVNVRWIFILSGEGREKVEEYNIPLADINSVVVNHEVVFLGGDQYINETYLRQVIDIYLGIYSPEIHNVTILNIFPLANESVVGQIVKINVIVQNNGDTTESFNVTLYTNSTSIEQLSVKGLESNELRILTFHWNTTGYEEGNYLLSAKINLFSNETNVSSNFYGEIVKLRRDTGSSLPLTLLGMLAVAFSLGFFETFSPCLIILLSFILSYTLGDRISFKESFLKILVFGVGFVSASAILGLACAAFFFSLPSLQLLLTWIVCVFAILFGLNLLGILRFQIQTKPLLRKIVEEHGFTVLGTLFLGFVFYFLDPCIAPIFVAIFPILFSDLFYLILLVFCLGAIIPFFAVGFFASSISKLTRNVYRHRLIFRQLSGIIVICYAFYLIFFYLL
jgi:cytochrome c biogenesis protein CcdA